MFAFDPLAAIERDSERVAAVVAGADRTAAVPGCPEWTLAGLVRHLGLVQRFWAQVVRQGEVEPGSDQDLPQPGDDLVGWYRDSAAELVAALRAEPFDRRCWTWWGEPATVGAVARHQVQEAAVHRWDAQSAVGAAEPIEAELAHDGVDEFLTVMVGKAADNLSGAVDLVATDTGGSWRVGPDAVGATLQATASDLVLLLYRRIPASAVAVAGDPVLVDEFVAAADTE
jgi:uncharacterized protein (TIGR03083 family)